LNVICPLISPIYINQSIIKSQYHIVSISIEIGSNNLILFYYIHFPISISISIHNIPYTIQYSVQYISISTTCLSLSIFLSYTVYCHCRYPQFPPFTIIILSQFDTQCLSLPLSPILHLLRRDPVNIAIFALSSLLMYQY
jgi:hypothetical protein